MNITASQVIDNPTTGKTELLTIEIGDNFQDVFGYFIALEIMFKKNPYLFGLPLAEMPIIAADIPKLRITLSEQDLPQESIRLKQENVKVLSRAPENAELSWSRFENEPPKHFFEGLNESLVELSNAISKKIDNEIKQVFDKRDFNPLLWEAIQPIFWHLHLSE